MAGVSKKVFAILQAAKEKGDEKAKFVDDLPSLSQDEADKKVDEFFKGKSMSSIGEVFDEEMAKDKIAQQPKSFADIKDEVDVEEPTEPEPPKAFKSKFGRIGSSAERSAARGSVPGLGGPQDIGGLNSYLGERYESTTKPLTKEDIDRLALQAGYDDPVVQRAMDEGTEAWNNPTVKEIVNPDGSKTFIYNMGSEEANQQRRLLNDKMVDHVIEEQTKKRPIKNDGVVYLIVGAAGAGKSTTIANRAVAKLGAYELDGDMFKDLTPETLGSDKYNEKYAQKFNYTDTRGIKYGKNKAPGVHNESTMLRDEMLEKVTEGGAKPNLVWPMVGAKESQVLPKIQALREKGYKVSLVNAFAEQSVAMERNKKRYFSKVAKGDPIRIVPQFEYNKGNSTQINKTFEDIITNYPDLLDGWAVYDGTPDAVKGKNAELVDASENWNFDE